MHTHMNRPNSSLDWVLSHWAHFTVLRFIFWFTAPSDHYFRSVCLFVCAEFFSAVFDPISIKLGHTLYVWV